jgi:hypothetical protein
MTEERKLYALTAGAVAAMLMAAWTIFVYAPEDALQGPVQRIFYMHVGSALAAFGCFALVLVGGVAFLWKDSVRGDRLARAAALVGLVFTTNTFVMGMIWAKPVWNWDPSQTWDARLTSTAVLWVIYAGYLLVRRFATPGRQAMRLAAVVGIVGFVDVPIVYFSVQWWRTLHPGPVLAARGVAVTGHEALDQPLLRVLGPELGAWLGEVHRAHGVDLRTGVRDLPALGAGALIGVGTQPNVELAAAAGIRCDQGIVVDELGRTDAPDVCAAGDCARFWSPLFEAAVRVEHYQTAHRHGMATGRAAAGDGGPFAEAPWFWSDQYELNLQYVGAGLAWDRSVVRGSLGEPPFTAFFLREDRLVGALGVDDGRTISQVRRLLETRTEVAAEQLTDPAVDLKRLSRPAPR